MALEALSWVCLDIENKTLASPNGRPLLLAEKVEFLATISPQGPPAGGPR